MGQNVLPGGVLPSGGLSEDAKSVGHNGVSGGICKGVRGSVYNDVSIL